jgi:hypothetical protein
MADAAIFMIKKMKPYQLLKISLIGTVRADRDLRSNGDRCVK